MSPEQGHGQDMDERSDIYSLGVIFFEMLTGRRPYQSDSALGIIYKHAREPVPLLPARVAHYQMMINMMMAKKPSERIQSAKDIDSWLYPANIEAFLAARRRLLAGTAVDGCRNCCWITPTASSRPHRPRWVSCIAIRIARAGAANVALAARNSAFRAGSLDHAGARYRIRTSQCFALRRRSARCSKRRGTLEAAGHVADRGDYRARSRERFARLVPLLPDDLAKFYGACWPRNHVAEHYLAFAVECGVDDAWSTSSR